MIILNFFLYFVLTLIIQKKYYRLISRHLNLSFSRIPNWNKTIIRCLIHQTLRRWTTTSGVLWRTEYITASLQQTSMSCRRGSRWWLNKSTLMNWGDQFFICLRDCRRWSSVKVKSLSNVFEHCPWFVSLICFSFINCQSWNFALRIFLLKLRIVIHKFSL